MSYHHNAKQEWRDNDLEDDVHNRHSASAQAGASPSALPFHNYIGNSADPVSPAQSFSHHSNNYRSPNAQPQSPSHHQHQHHQQDEGAEEQYPVGRPLSYFPTHHQPLSQQEYDEEQRTSQYHQMSPLEHAHSPLSSRTPEWGGGGYSGYQAGPAAPVNDIPLVGIDIISSNLEAARHGNQFSDTRTPENMAEPAQLRGTEHSSIYSAGAGVGGTGADGQYNQYQHQQQHQQYPYDNKPLEEDGRNAQYAQSAQPPPSPSHSHVDNHGEPVPKVLLDPKVQRQLSKRKTWRPWFVWIVSAIQISVLIFEIVKGYQRTGRIIETHPFNPMIGPGTGTIIAVGARFVPCMRSTYLDSLQIECPDNTTSVCTLSEICGFTPIASTGKPPNQWFRFITPIFLHGGVVHLLFNLAFQMRTGADLERDMGWWRFGIIYMCSGIVGFVFGGNFAPLLSPSMGASGAIFGLIGCLVLDLIQNWKLIVRPCWELSKLSIMILVSFAFGLLPFLDNFAHIGGFVAGILTGLVFMPVVYFSKRDKYIKLGLRFVALPLIVLILVLGLTNFYKGANNCSWCRYLSCLPINGWCDAFNTPTGAPTTGTGN
ncbi:hypothetical protein EDD11_004364 [Mortierella claussenii]|nr:hypothetical protein EDD11_004364 [Mortierella claussenii]